MILLVIYTKMNIKKLVMYKFDFFLKLISVLIWIFTGLFNIYILNFNFEMLSNWKFNELKLLYSVWALSFGVYNAFGNGIMEIEKLVITGKMDCLLIKPINPLFQIAFSKINVMGIGFIIFGIVSTVVSLLDMNMSIGFGSILFLILSSILGGGLIFSICLIFACTSFYGGKSSRLLKLGYDLHKFTQYPIDIYNKAIATVLTVFIPFAFSNYYPVKYILGKSSISGAVILCIVVPVLVTIVAYTIWCISLLSYEGSGS